MRNIAEAIALGANQLLPVGFEASARGGDIAVVVRGRLIGSVGVGTILRDRPDPWAPHEIVGVAENVLNWLQDLVSEDSTVPWPPVAGTPSGYMAAYRAAVGAGVLRLWFEADGKPVPLIPSTELRS